MGRDERGVRTRVVLTPVDRIARRGELVDPVVAQPAAADLQRDRSRGRAVDLRLVPDLRDSASAPTSFLPSDGRAAGSVAVPPRHGHARDGARAPQCVDSVCRTASGGWRSS